MKTIKNIKLILLIVAMFIAPALFALACILGWSATPLCTLLLAIGMVLVPAFIITWAMD